MQPDFFEFVKKDYRYYKFLPREILLCVGECLGFTSLISFLFYKSSYALILILIIFPFYFKQKQQEKRNKQKDNLNQDFKEMINSVSNALVAGYSLENAFLEAQNEFTRLEKKSSDMLRELEFMNAKVKLNEPLEELILDFATRSDSEDIMLFGQILFFAKRSGGDFTKIIKNTVLQISEKADVRREIEVMVAQKKLEQKIMNVVPLFILLYMSITSSKYMEVLYNNMIGIVLMSILLSVFLGTMYYSKRITDIQI